MKPYWICIPFILFACSKESKEVSETDGISKRNIETVEHSVPAQVNTNLLEGFGKFVTADSSLDLYKDSEMRLPVLIYYAIDSVTTEPYLKAAIDYEIKTLEESCNGKKHVNWMIIRNSDIVNNKSIQICFQGKEKTKTIKHILQGMKQYNDSFFANESPSETKGNSKKLKNCRKVHNQKECLPHGVMSRNKELAEVLKELGLSVENSNLEEINLLELYNSFPTINPYFFKNILNTDKNLTPFTENLYTKFLHVKSHGHIDYVLTGLLDHQLKNKIEYQEKQLKEHTPEELNLIGPVDGQEVLIAESTERIFSEIKKVDKFVYVDSGIEANLTSIDFPSYEPSDNSLNLSPTDLCSLNQDKNQSLGVESQDGLGVSGIYLGNHIGITANDFLNYLTNVENVNKFDSKEFRETLTRKPLYRFVFIESCDSNIGTRWPIKSNYINEKISAVYSADGTLWFRNIDYNLIFKAIEKNKVPYTHSAMMQQLLIDITESIKVKIPKNPEEHKEYLEKYDEIIKLLGSR